MADPTPLSPAARAVLTAVTWKKYDVPPEGLPAFAEEMAPLIAAALRAAAARAIRWPEHYEGLGPSAYDDGWNEALDYIMSIATELEGHGSA